MGRAEALPPASFPSPIKSHRPQVHQGDESGVCLFVASDGWLHPATRHGYGRVSALRSGMWDLVNGPSGDWPDDVDERYGVEVVSGSGSPATVDFWMRADQVEIWFKGQCRAVLNRHVLRCWLAEPQTPLVVGEVAFSLDRIIDAAGRVALSLPDLLVWTLAPEALAALRCRV
jgi:hypothetical protein